MISLLFPSRGRPENLERLLQSLVDTTDGDLQLVIALDEDDGTVSEYIEIAKKFETLEMQFDFLIGPRTLLSEYWNLCFEKATGDILMHCGDDLIFRTEGWDTKVKEAFAQYPDNIVFVYGRDGHARHDENFGTHGFLHRDWPEVIGYFVPPYFSSDYNDTWLNDVAKMIDRHHFVDILTEHMHPTFGKAEWDQTHRDRVERHRRDNVANIYADKASEREFDAQILRGVIDGHDDA